ncbi:MULTISPECIES: NTP transferase domain-containing protein [Ramlibacter]|uniref:nucleotidyltransferase family protein n=1 Tax=Ramlibacter TaxID=174951 RepID=UPI002AAFBAA1|nr:NTP transferase domain-containing protein [Ramlibacter aquaticus]
MSGPVVLLLASGRGERFTASGGQGSKLRAPLAGRPVLEWTRAAAQASGLAVHVEDAGHPGMGDSIAAAARAVPDADAWLVLPGDLPLVRPDTLRAVAQAVGAGEIVVPSFGGERGHPVAFGREFGAQLRALTGAQGAAAIVKAATQAGRVRVLPLDDRGIVTDIDTVADLQAAERLLLSAPSA